MGELDEMLDLPAALRKPAQVHGREMVALVYGAGMASEAVKVLTRRAQALRDTETLRAVTLLGEVFNQTSSAYCRKMGWEEAVLVQCDKDIMLSFAGEIQVVPTILVEH